MLEYPIYIAGEFKTSPILLNVTNPFTGQVFAHTYNATEGQYEEAVKQAVLAKKQLAEMPVYDRYKALRHISDTILAHHKQLAEILSMESGKPMIYAEGGGQQGSQTFLLRRKKPSGCLKNTFPSTEPGGSQERRTCKIFSCGSSGRHNSF